MTAARVVTWNVLHRVHGENWSEPTIGAHPDEAARAAGIAARIAAWLDEGVDAVGLQEVSGDLLARVREVAAGRAEVLAHRYPRVPASRVEPSASAPLVDPSEHLVIVAGGATRLASATFDDDPGKGYLAASLPSGLVVICTHVSFGKRRRGQLARLADAARGGRAIVLGDFNAAIDDVTLGLGAAGDLHASDLAGAGFTREPANGQPGKVIDHVVALGGRVEGAEILDGGGSSDHRPVRAIARFA